MSKLRFPRISRIIAAIMLATAIAPILHSKAKAGLIEVIQGSTTVTGTIGVAIDLAKAFGLGIGSSPGAYLTLTVTGDKEKTDLLLQGQKITTTLTENYTVNVQGDTIDANGGSGTALFWTYDLNFIYNNNFFGPDVVNITGGVTHKFNPHKGEVGGGPKLDYSIVANSRGAVGTTVSVVSPVKFGPHFGTTDDYDILLTLVNEPGQAPVERSSRWFRWLPDAVSDAA